MRGQLPDPIGRPSVMTEEVIVKLEEAFMKGLTDKEACLYSEIAPSTLYKYCQENPYFAERKEILKDNVRMQAKLNVAGAINEGDKPLSQWYLERKAKDEFSTRSELTGPDGKDLFQPSPEEREAADKALNDIL